MKIACRKTEQTSCLAGDDFILTVCARNNRNRSCDSAAAVRITHSVCSTKQTLIIVCAMFAYSVQTTTTTTISIAIVDCVLISPQTHPLHLVFKKQKGSQPSPRTAPPRRILQSYRLKFHEIVTYKVRPSNLPLALKQCHSNLAS